MAFYSVLCLCHKSFFLMLCFGTVQGADSLFYPSSFIHILYGVSKQQHEAVQLSRFSFHTFLSPT